MKSLEELGISPWPWRVTEIAGIVSRHGEVISGQYGPYNWHNARLMSAAPKLYEALEECERKLDAIDPYGNLLEKVRAALAEASGEEVLE